MLAKGYRKARQSKNPGMATMIGVENFYPNTLVNYLKSAVFEVLLSRIGEELMRWILTNTLLFISLPNHCYFIATAPHPLRYYTNRAPSAVVSPTKVQQPQLTTSCVQGERARHQKRKRAIREKKQEAKRKKAKVELRDSGPVPASTPAIGPHRVPFLRSRIFYANTYTNSQTALTPHHILDQVAGTNTGARELLKDIMCDPKSTDAPAPTSKNKKAKSRDRLNKRLQPLVPVFCTLIRRHKHQPYRFLLHHHCPLPASLLPPLSNTQQLPPVGQLLQHYTVATKVANFLIGACLRVIPAALLGSQHNRSILFKAIYNFVCLRRYEAMCPHEVLHSLKLKELRWLEGKIDQPSNTSTPRKSPRKRKKKQHKPKDPVTVQLRRQKIAVRWIRWIFNSFVIPLLRNNFYVTGTIGQDVHTRQQPFLTCHA
eukprot:TRINITY_DN9926_c0_g1_i1.p1 TRINITY_DN9926_c0_g1~~TRINITY_DN9926_c0_g1_i1.p1  ORF type:complete len:428 (-),score=34.89 TRINITY_DN9926_c0_g1_i1:1533-2816(-)